MRQALHFFCASGFPPETGPKATALCGAFLRSAYPYSLRSVRADLLRWAFLALRHVPLPKQAMLLLRIDRF